MRTLVAAGGGMHLWLFSGPASLRLLSKDETDTNLPDEFGPWKLIRAVQLAGDAPDEKEVIAFIREHGYCCSD